MTDDTIRERAAAPRRRARPAGRLVAEESVEGSPAIAACLDIVADRLEGVAATVERLDFDGVPALTPASVTAMPPGV